MTDEAAVAFVLGLVASAVLAIVVLHLWRQRLHPPESGPIVRVFGTYSPALTWIERHRDSRRAIGGLWMRRAFDGNVGFAIEILIVGLWAMVVGRNLLNLDPQVWPTGNEFGGQVYGFHLWDLVRQCGLCALWNGSINGGFPFLSDPYSGALHPIPAVATLAAGAINGAKLTIVASFWMAGVAQWWMGRAIGLGRLGRVWTALVAASAGSIVGRVEVGNIPLPLSIAAVSLALAASLDLALHRTRKAAILFGVTLALAVVAGQGYMQIALIFWVPWIALLILGAKRRPDRVWREFALAFGLAVLLAGIFLAPFLHFWPYASKFSDQSFVGSQPLQYLPLNLVINEFDFFMSPLLGKLPYPYLHTLYIGWVPVILAVLGLGLGRRQDARLLAVLAGGALTMFWLASGDIFRWLAPSMPWISGVRHPALMASLAVPPILALAGYGLDRVLELRWPRAGLGVSLGEARSGISISTAWLLAIPLVASLVSTQGFGQHFLVMDDKSDIYQAVTALGTSEAEWVSVPFGEHFWNGATIAAGFKMTEFVAPYWWDGREPPEPFLEATRDTRGSPPWGHLGDIPIYQKPENPYAFVHLGDQVLPCHSLSTGGDIRVMCRGSGGRLVVKENGWSGWSATVNGDPAILLEGPWLSVDIPPGEVGIRFRYLPWDALLGGLLSLSGIVLVVVLWIRSGRPAASSAESGEPAQNAAAKE